MFLTAPVYDAPYRNRLRGQESEEDHTGILQDKGLTILFVVGWVLKHTVCKKVIL